MADDVVRRAEQFFIGITRDAQEHPVGVGDDAVRIGFADDDFFSVEESFDTRRADGGENGGHAEFSHGRKEIRYEQRWIA